MDDTSTHLSPPIASKGYPPFVLNQSRYDQATFEGRLRHFLDVVNPSSLLTRQSELDRCVSLLEAFRAGRLPSGTTDADLWHAQKIKQAIVHPDTGEKIPQPFRMAGYVPYGAPIVFGLLLPVPAGQAWRIVFWQWLNQSHNACVNYCNRNASQPTPMSRFVAGYSAAVGSAVSIALCLNWLVTRADKLAPSTKLLVQRFVPFPAVATASVCNVVLMRNNELSVGIEVVDSEGRSLGSSRVAARRALLETALTRAFLPAPILIIPPLIISLLERHSKLWQKQPKIRLPLQALIVTMAFAGALPIAIALFPQTSSIKVENLELEIQLKTKDKVAFYNKGL